MDKVYPLFKIAELIAREKSNELSAAEKEVLQDWLTQHESNKSIYESFQDGNSITNDLEDLKKFDTGKAYAKVEPQLSPKHKRFNIPVYFKYAAVVTILLGFSYFMITRYRQPNAHQFVQNIILPGKQKAILITAGNQKIELDSSGNKQIIKDETANIVNEGSTLSYHENNAPVTANSASNNNTLITPRGGEYTVILSDGTEVKLNSASKLVYPVVFNSNIREVTLEGEAFFKVKKSSNVPFVVKANNVNVRVYGTVFNVSAYSNESLVQTTLVEGSIGVTIANGKSLQETKIKPGQQHVYDKSSGKMETKEVNPESFIAWTKGMFAFENESIENILNVLSRWYNFDVEYKNDLVKRQRFTLSLGRYDNVLKILDMISASSNLKFSTKDNIITVYTN